MPAALSSRVAATDGGARNQPLFTIKVGGQALPRLYLPLTVRVQKEANRISTAHLVFQDGTPAPTGQYEFALSEQDFFVPGTELEISAGYMGGQEKTIFKGLVVKHAIEGRGERVPRLLVTAKDAFVKTTLVPRRRYYTNQTDSQVAEAIVGEYGQLSIQAEATSVTHPELLQYDATDWDFLLLRAAANGLLCLLDDGQLTLAPPDPGQEPVVSLQYGATILDFDAEVDARDQAVSLRASAWDPAAGAAAVADAAEPAANRQGNFAAGELAEAFGAEQELRHDGPLPTDELQAWADARLQWQRLAKVRGRVQCFGNADIKPNTVVEISGLGKRFNGPAYVSGVSHRIEDGLWLSDVQIGLDPRGPLATLASGGAAPLSPPAAAGLVAAPQGLQIGVVTALAGDDTGEERIAVTLPLVDAEGAGARARILSLDAGKDRGFFFRPEVGDEVVVGFLHNDPREAVVLGALHGSRNTVPAPFQTDDANPLKGYVSRSKLQVIFDDEKKIMTLTTPGGNLLQLDDDAQGITLQDQHGNKIVMSKDGISLESSKLLTLKATTDAELSAQNATLKAQAQLKASGASGAEFSSSATAVIKGATVMIN